MKNITDSINEYLNETKVDGTDLNDSLSKSDFGKLVKHISDIKQDSVVIVKDHGMNEWIGHYKVSFKGVKYKLTSTLQFDDTSLDYSKSELEEEIKDKAVYLQKD